MSEWLDELNRGFPGLGTPMTLVFLQRSEKRALLLHVLKISTKNRFRFGGNLLESGSLEQLNDTTYTQIDPLGAEISQVKFPTITSHLKSPPRHSTSTTLRELHPPPS
ncbi:hypothetical protein EVAR_28674_1 [Eumeta japonica]|uniref:Uncharacterized protein n=1 Tax=Eumeta variegata TaxID=151549 RepID=A0A4C1V4J7_EUMVA|nr:hypothetical protein EVAR_28674_1 [Eumeta japonica]